MINKKLLSLLFVLLSFCSPVVEAMPAQVVIIRHGEKNPLNGQLLPKGQSRAGALVAYLTEFDPTSTNPPLLTLGPPQVLFASRPAEHSDDFTIRCIQTLAPLSGKLMLPIHSPFGPLQEQVLADFIVNSPKYDGKYVLICWHHTLIASLIEAFGYLPPAGILPNYPNRYDLVWLLRFPVSSTPTVIDPILQELLFGDSTTFP
jgi:hypothetical protein